MATRLIRWSLTGVNLYATLRSRTSGSVWSTSTSQMVTFAVSGWTNYAISLTETPTGSYLYTFTSPSGLPSGSSSLAEYSLEVYQRATGTPGISDIVVYREVLWWNGVRFSEVGVDLGTLLAGTTRLLGLSQDNSTLNNFVHNANGDLLTAIRRVYNSAANALVDDGSTGLIAVYTIEATYDVNNLLTSYKQLRVT